MPRSRLLFTAPIVLAIVLAGIFVIRSRGDDGPELQARQQPNCSPVARADVAATRPTDAVTIDPLANDTDAEGDPLVFQIVSTTGGTATVDDATTPTDAADDRISFTPAVPPPDKAVIAYQAVDPDGALGESIVSVYVNPEGLLPAGVQSDPITAQNAVGDDSEECGGVAGPTSTTDPNALVATTAVPPTTFEVTDTTAGSTPRRSGGTTTRRTTTTRPRTGTTQPATGTTQPAPPPTTQPPATTTTKPPTTSPPPTTPPECGSFPVNGTEEEQDAWRDCVADNT